MSTFPYFTKDGYLMKTVNEDNKKVNDNPAKTKDIQIARRTEIKDIIYDIDTGEVSLTLEFEYLGETREKVISRGDLTRREIQKLLKYGVDVSDCNASEVVNFLTLQEESKPITATHTNIGFGDHKDKLVFKHYKAIGCDSVYTGELAIKPTGSYKEWKNLIKTEVLGHTPLELALVFGLSAPVATLIAKETGLEVLVVHICGDSSQGKTTAAQVAVSPFGSPHLQCNGLIRQWNGTSNAILGQVRNNHGIPMAFDEASSHKEDLSSFIYMLASGKDKGRLNKNSELMSSAYWQGTLLSTAEHSLLARSSKNTGIQMRLLEFANVRWTKSSENADHLKKGLIKNYGHAGPKFVKYLMEMGNDDIIELWQKWKKNLLKSMVSDPFADRIANKLAIFLATAEMANKGLKLELNIPEIQKLLLAFNETNRHERDLGKNALDHFKEMICKHKDKFETASHDPSHPSSKIECWGSYVKSAKHGSIVSILPIKFSELIKEGGFEDVKTVLHDWKEKGILDCDKGHSTKKRKIGGVETRMHIIKLL